jgi:hypothetical protein
MNKKIKVLLCTSALLGAMYVPAFADDLYVNSGNQEDITTETTYETISNEGTLQNSSTLHATTINSSGNITNNATINATTINNYTNGSINNNSSINVTH